MLLEGHDIKRIMSTCIPVFISIFPLLHLCDPLCRNYFQENVGPGPRRRTNFSARPSNEVRTIQSEQPLNLTVFTEDPDNNNPSKWHAIAKHVPNRTNKDCRKRWFAKMASDVVKGGWAPDEDEKLVQGIERYGTRLAIPTGQ